MDETTFEKVGLKYEASSDEEEIPLIIANATN